MVAINQFIYAPLIMGASHRSVLGIDLNNLPTIEMINICYKIKFLLAGAGFGFDLQVMSLTLITACLNQVTVN